MHYIVYRTTNKLNGNYYIGVHKIKGEESLDRYLGSGVGLKRAVRKYGRNAFVRETLFRFETPDEAYNREIELLENVYKLRECYNMYPGGNGTRKEICDHSPEWRAKVSAANSGKRHTSATKRKIGSHQIGDLNVAKRPEVRAKIAAAARIRRGACTGLLYWNNGIIRKRALVSPGLGWKRGHKF